MVSFVFYFIWRLHLRFCVRLNQLLAATILLTNKFSFFDEGKKKILFKKIIRFQNLKRKTLFIFTYFCNWLQLCFYLLYSLKQMRYNRVTKLVL